MNKFLRKLISSVMLTLTVCSQFSITTYAAEQKENSNSKYSTEIAELKEKLEENCEEYQKGIENYELIKTIPKYYKVVEGNDGNAVEFDSKNNCSLIEVTEAEYSMASTRQARTVPGFEYPDPNGYTCDQYSNEYLALVTEVFRSIKNKNEFLNIASYEWLSSPKCNFSDLLYSTVSEGMIIDSSGEKKPISQSIYNHEGTSSSTVYGNSISWDPGKRGIAAQVACPTNIYTKKNSAGFLQFYFSFVNDNNVNKHGGLVTAYNHYYASFGSISWSATGYPSVSLSIKSDTYQVAVDFYSHQNFN